jgi:hypothetical protein
MLLIALDRDNTMRTGGGPIPLSIFKGLVAKGCEVWAIGNQVLCDELGIPGVSEILESCGIESSVIEENYCGAIERRGRLHLLSRMFPDTLKVVVDDHDLSDMEAYGWLYLSPDRFMSWAFGVAI